MSITLYEIVTSDGVSVSPFVWRSKFSLARKGLPYRSEKIGLSDVCKLFDGRFQTAPIIDLGDRQMNESFVIADWLDEAHPNRPAIFSCPAERAMIGFFDQWLVHAVLLPGILPIYALDIYNRVAVHDRDYYRESREMMFGRTLEEIVANREDALPALRDALEPVRQTIAEQPFLGGQMPNYADMCMLSLFMFVGTIATLPLLAANDPLLDYADRGLGHFALEAAALGLNLSEGRFG